MANKDRAEVSREEHEQLIEDATYLQDEADALKHVIEEVPYSESPPGGPSIAEMLLLIDHAQLTYYRPIIEESLEQNRPVNIDDFDEFQETFEVNEEKIGDIQNILGKLVKHRKEVVNLLESISLKDWETSIYDDDQEIDLIDIARHMIRFERGKLKEIADLVMSFNQEKEARREIDKRAERQDAAGRESPTSQQEA